MAPHKQQAYDIEEIMPNRFLVNNAHAFGVLRGEGERQGKLFELTSWRREGLIARLVARGFTVRTLADQLDGLPALPEAQPIGDEGLKPLATEHERYSYFDTTTTSWCSLEPFEHKGQRVVLLRDGWIVRRRKGRALPSFYVASLEPNGTIGLRPIDETSALLAGYAQASSTRPISLVARRAEGHYVLPDVAIPKPYQDFLRHIAKKTQREWHITEPNWPLVVALFERLGMQLTAV